jgi:hypothetical protein
VSINCDWKLVNTNLSLNSGIKIPLLAATNPQKKKTVINAINDD